MTVVAEQGEAVGKSLVRPLPTHPAGSSWIQEPLANGGAR